MQIDSIASLGKPFTESIRSGEGLGLSTNAPAAGKATGINRSFGEFLQDAIGEVNEAQAHAGELTNQFAAGKNVDIHEMMIAGQEAGVMLNLTMQVRNKLVDAYQEIMRVNV
jgi:flagellar hook-basal body complex protein FliE